MDIEKSMMTGMMGIFMAVLMLQVVQQLIPAPPTKDYCCPICAECFYTYDELYAHFTTAHPSQPIDIIWSD